jgi:hypothetical protein
VETLRCLLLTQSRVRGHSSPRASNDGGTIEAKRASI